MQINKPAPSFSPAAAPGSKAVLTLPIGPTYKRVDIVVTAASGLDASDIGRINVVMNGVIIQTFKNLQRLMDINSYHARPADSMSGTAATFSIHFASREFDSGLPLNPNAHAARLAPCMGTAGLTSLTVEMEIASGAPASIAMTANVVSIGDVQPPGQFMQIKEYPWASSVAAEVDYDKLLKDQSYACIHLFKSDINAVKIIQDDRIYVDATKSLLELDQKNAAPFARVPVSASATHVDFCLDGNIMDTFKTYGAQDLRMKLTFGTTGSVDIVTETLSGLSE